MLKARESMKRQEEDTPHSEPLENDDKDSPQIAGEVTSAMDDLLDLQQNESDRPNVEELVSSLNADQSRVVKNTSSTRSYTSVAGASARTTAHVCQWCRTGKSFLIRTVRALVSRLWDCTADSTVCAVTAPTGLAAFNVGGVTIHRLLQLPIENEGRAASYWRLGKEALKVMRASLPALTVDHRQSLHRAV